MDVITPINSPKPMIGDASNGNQRFKKAFALLLILILLLAIGLLALINHKSHQQTANLNAAEQRWQQAQSKNRVGQSIPNDLNINSLTTKLATIKGDLGVGGNVDIGGTLTVNGQPITNSSSGASSSPVNTSGFALLSGKQTFSGANKFSSPANVFVGNGSGLSGVTATTLNGQTGAFYQNASNLNAGTISTALLPSGVTLQGNSFNGASQLVQLDGSGKLPAVDGSNLTNISATTLNGQTGAFYQNASNMNAGTLNDTRLSSNVALLNRNSQTFTGNNQTFENAADSTTSFQIQNAAGNSNLFVADTTHGLIGIGMQPSNIGPMLQINGSLSVNTSVPLLSAVVGNNCSAADAAICFGGDTDLYRYNTGGALKTDGQFLAQSLFATGFISFGTFNMTSFVTPNGPSVDTKINIPVFDPGDFSQFIALGLPSTGSSSARAISLFDARTSAHQPTISVFSPDQNNVFGLSWEGSNSTAYIKTTGGAIALRSGSTDLLSVSSTGELGLSNNARGINVAIGNGANTVAVVFADAYPDANFAVLCTPSYGSTCYVTNKSASGFTMHFGTPTPDANQTVDWFVVR